MRKLVHLFKFDQKNEIEILSERKSSNRNDRSHYLEMFQRNNMILVRWMPIGMDPSGTSSENCWRLGLTLCLVQRKIHEESFQIQNFYSTPSRTKVWLCKIGHKGGVETHGEVEIRSYEIEQSGGAKYVMLDGK